MKIDLDLCHFNFTVKAGDIRTEADYKEILKLAGMVMYAGGFQVYIPYEDLEPILNGLSKTDTYTVTTDNNLNLLEIKKRGGLFIFSFPEFAKRQKDYLKN